MSLGTCVECHTRPAQYTYAGLTSGVCRLCWYNCTGASPSDLAEHDATSEAEYTRLESEYRQELLASNHHAKDALLAEYRRQGYAWA